MKLQGSLKPKASTEMIGQLYMSLKNEVSLKFEVWNLEF